MGGTRDVRREREATIAEKRNKLSSRGDESRKYRTKQGSGSLREVFGPRPSIVII